MNIPAGTLSELLCFPTPQNILGFYFRCGQNEKKKKEERKKKKKASELSCPLQASAEPLPL